MAIKIYQKGDPTKLSANFRAREFDCHGVGCCTSTPIDEKLVEYLQNIRDHFQKPVEITAYRCATYNAMVENAAPKSRHTFGQAADFHIDGVPCTEIAKYAESIGVKGIGLYALNAMKTKDWNTTTRNMGTSTPGERSVNSPRSTNTTVKMKATSSAAPLSTMSIRFSNVTDKPRLLSSIRHLPCRNSGTRDTREY